MRAVRGKIKALIRSFSASAIGIWAERLRSEGGARGPPGSEEVLEVHCSGLADQLFFSGFGDEEEDREPLDGALGDLGKTPQPYLRFNDEFV
ncbi:hypothetical protein F0562_014968 [Nyssa sinensis]|uniref:Uncharacterized protein n=1 Tax=Nyssa sinensis TaxID=561372 RepID=A0A5J4ZQN5_9ASTE|nr:hypothetical protein F0562_014968 [Nyssa sinensis]